MDIRQADAGQTGKIWPRGAESQQRSLRSTNSPAHGNGEEPHRVYRWKALFCFILRRLIFPNDNGEKKALGRFRQREITADKKAVFLTSSSRRRRRNERRGELPQGEAQHPPNPLIPASRGTSHSRPEDWSPLVPVISVANTGRRKDGPFLRGKTKVNHFCSSLYGSYLEKELEESREFHRRQWRKDCWVLRNIQSVINRIQFYSIISQIVRQILNFHDISF